MFIWVIAMLVGSVATGSVLATNSTVTSPIQEFMSYAQVWSEQGWGAALVYPLHHSGFWTALGQVMLLDFPIFGPVNSPWQILRWIILGPIIATVVFGVVLMVMTFFRKTI